MLDDPAQWNGSIAAAGRPGPASRWLGRPMSEPVVWETCPDCGDLAALVWALDGKVAGSTAGADVG
jgi:hypothetical protein